MVFGYKEIEELDAQFKELKEETLNSILASRPGQQPDEQMLEVLFFYLEMGFNAGCLATSIFVPQIRDVFADAQKRDAELAKRVPAPQLD